MFEDPDLFLRAPDTTFFLSAEERAETFVAFDNDVVEQILRWVRPEQRDSFRRTFFVELEHQIATEGAFFINSADRPELAALIRQLGHFDT